MNPENEPRKFVVIQECSGGNESVGNEWLETKIFNGCVSLEEVFNWKATLNGACGKLIITLPK